MNTLSQQVYDLIARFPVCSLNAIHAQFAVRHGAQAVAGALTSLRLTGKVQVVEKHKYKAL